MFALAICLMVFELPSKSNHESNLYIPKHVIIYATIGTIIEVIMWTNLSISYQY